MKGGLGSEKSVRPSVPGPPPPEGRRNEKTAAFTTPRRSGLDCRREVYAAFAAAPADADAVAAASAAAADVVVVLSAVVVVVAVVADGVSAMAMAVVAAASAAAGLCHRPKLATIPLRVVALFYFAGGRFKLWEMLRATALT